MKEHRSQNLLLKNRQITSNCFRNLICTGFVIVSLGSVGVSSNEQAQICVSANEADGCGRERWEGRAAAVGAPSISELGSLEKLLP